MIDDWSVIDRKIGLENLQEKVLSDKKCREIDQRNPCVENVFSNMCLSKLMIIGQQPSYYGNRKEPFTGRDSFLFDKILNGLELSRREVYITNVVKCVRKERASSAVIDYWRDVLAREIELVNPEIIAVLGAVAYHWFFPGNNFTADVGQLRQTLVRPIFVAFHPAYVIRKYMPFIPYAKTFEVIKKFL